MKKIAFLAILLVVGCKSKQSITHTKETVRTDTIYKFHDRIIDRPVVDSIIVEKPCDSLGNLKPFSGVLKTNHSRVSVSSDRGNLAILFNQDSIISENKQERKVKIDKSSEVKEKVIVKYRCSWKLWLWAILATIGFIVVLLRDIRRKIDPFS